jgi:DNA modification methylase
MAINKLILGDCLEVLKTIDSETIDLIYIDPPFFSNRTYEVIWGDKGEIRSFEDRFSGGIEHYISWLKERIQEMHRLLKPTGSIFVHCDWHANAEIKVFILNKVFTSNNFRSEITWKRTVPKGNSKTLANNTDTLFWYSKHKSTFTFNPIYFPVDDPQHYRHKDEKGRIYQDTSLDAPAKGYLYEWKGITKQWRCSLEKMQEYEKNDLLYYTKSGVARFKRFLEEQNGRALDNFWADIPPVNSQANERIGYPTQKPEKLLDRIIKICSNEGDTILDCFVGGGTTIAVADKLNRNWIGIDQSVQAVKVTEFRLNKQQDLFSQPFSVFLHKYDYDTLRYKDAFEFETWIVGQFGGLANSKQRGDLGLDGRTRENQPIQVKRSDNIGRNVIDNFHSAVMRYDKSLYEKNKLENKPVGFVIAFSFGKGAIQEVARLKVEEQIIIELVTVETIVPIAKKPTLQVVIEDLGKIKEMRQIQFTATGESEAGIEFYAWDFGYNEQNFTPEILLDKTGKQTYLFKAGEHKIAVKVVDNEGLESLEVIKLKVNGVVQRN